MIIFGQELAMMKADVLDSFEDIFVCTHYLQDGEKIDFEKVKAGFSEKYAKK